MKPRCSSGVGGDGFAARRRQSRPRIFLVRRRFAPLAPALCAAAVVAFAAVSRAAVITWDGGNSDWVDGALGNFNWIPTDEPDADDTAVFNSANTVNLADHNAVAALGLAGGISLNTNNYGLDIGGGLGLSGAGTTLIIGGTKSIVDADDVTIDPSARLRLNRGTLLLDEDAGTAVLDINAGGELFGTGVVSFLDVYAVATPVLTNDGILRAGPLLAVGLPSAGSMALTGTGNCRFDLDGTGALEPGVVTVMGNQTLDINAPLADPFRGDLNLYHGSVLDMSASWTLDGGTLDADNGAVGGSIPVAAGVSYVAGAPFYQDGGTITVTDEDGTLQFDAMFNQLSGNFANNGKVVFNANASIGASAHFTMPTASSSIKVGPGATVTVNQADFDADGGDSPANVLTVAPLGTLNLHLGAGADTTLNGSLHLQRGTLRVTTATGAWRISGPVTIDGFSQDSVIRGDALSCSGQVTTVETGSGLTVNAPVTLEATSLCIVDGLLNLTAGTVFAGGRLEGNGALGLDGGSRVVADTSVDLPSFDWDGGVLGETHTIESGVTFTINSSLFDDIMDDAVTLVGDGSKLAFGGTSYWEMGATLTTNSAASGTVTIAGGARLLLASITGVNWQVNGNTIATAEVTFGRNSTTSVAAAARLTVDSNECWFDDAVITGAGTFYPSPALNSVFVPSTISVANLNFDRGDWRVAPGAFLDLQVGDYDADAPLNGFDKTLALDSGAIRVLTGDEVFVMNGTLHLHRSGDMPYWTGQAIQFGDDSGFHDAKLAVTGSGPSGIYAPILFKSDAEVDIAAGCQLLLARPVTFQSVNAGNNARFTGAGQLSTFDDVAVQETTTFEMAGGTVDLDGADGIGDLILVTAPFTIRAATLAPFGGTNPGGGTNQIDVNSWTGAGTLTVELDNPADEWTLNGPGVLRLINDPSSTIPRTLLAGSTLNTKGTLNIIGDVRSTARL
nr:hypothetical protein [Akkermansiaceae bacterium]